MNKKISHNLYITGIKLKNKLWGIYPILAPRFGSAKVSLRSPLHFSHSTSLINILVFLFSFATFGLILCIFKATTLFAADPLTYKLLADLPGIGDSPKHDEYLKGAIKLIIGITTALAVLMMVYAGVFGYIGGATNQASRTTAKTRMWGALLGLTLALVSYIILNTINPDLLSLDLVLP